MTAPGVLRKIRMRRAANQQRGRAEMMRGGAVTGRAALGPQRFAVGSVAGIFQRGHAIFFALALEFFLGRLEACDARCDFFPLESEAVFLFGHDHPFLILVLWALANAIGARIGTGHRGIVIVWHAPALAVDKIGVVLVAGAPSR